MTVPSPRADVDALQTLARRATEDITPVLEDATDAAWTFHTEMPGGLPDDDARPAADFLNDASPNSRCIRGRSRTMHSPTPDRRMPLSKRHQPRCRSDTSRAN